MPPEPAQLIAGQYAVDFGAPLPAAGGGLRAFAAADRRGRRDLMAVEARASQPPRAHALATLAGIGIEGLLTPLAHGPLRPPGADEAYFVVTQAPPGPPLTIGLRPWTEGELLDDLLRPAALALERLERRGLTHRAIRPDNLFRAGPGQPVVLGQGWAAPPAALQPAVFEPPYMAMCGPTARGDGSIADDVYALGATMLALALGRLPLAGMDEAAVVRTKLDRGSFAALAAEERLPGMIADLVRGMLAADPEHRPPPSLLLDPATARSRRVAARPPRRAQRPLELSSGTVWDARSLAAALGANPAAGVAALRDGTVERWIRRSLGDPVLANRITEKVNAWAPDGTAPHGATDGPMLVQVSATLDPLAPVCWPGLPLWPDALGTTLATAHAETPSLVESVHKLIEAEAARLWALERADRCDVGLIRTETRQHILTMRTRTGGALRLLYTLNPLLACGSPLLVGRCVARIADLLPALDAIGASPAAAGEVLPVDEHVAAFVAARGEEMVDKSIFEPGAPGIAAQVRLLARLQGRFHAAPLPGLTGWLGRHAGRLFAPRRNKARREHATAEFRRAAELGLFAPMLALVDDPGEARADAEGVARAATVIAAADAELRALAGAAVARGEHARRLGQEIAAGCGLATLAAVLAYATLG